MAADNILDILTKVDRPHFTIDGKSYEMRHPNEFGMVEFHKLSKKGVELIAAAEDYKSDPDGAFEAITKCMDELLDMVAPNLPAEAKEKLNPLHVQQLMEAFIGLSRIEPKPDAPQLPPKPLQDSLDSTEAIQKTG